MKTTSGRLPAGVLATGIALLFAGSSYCSPVFPTGLAPGSTYQLVFVTLGTTFATSTNISDYNAFVTAQAATDPTLAAFDTANAVTWTVIGSTQTVDADVNAPSSGSVYNLDGIQVASATNTLYSGSLLSAINFDQDGNASITGVWTGSTSAGTVAGGINDLGQTFPEYGLSNATSSAWIAYTNGVESDNFVPVYALSSVITVPQASSAPEPASLALTAAALLGFGLSRLRRRRA
jgi:hypothetical protein